MRIAIIGQQKFGKAVLEAFIDRGDSVAGVFCAPEKPGSAPDPLRLAAEQRGLGLFQLPSLKDPEAIRVLRGLDVDIGIMAYVLQFAPQEFTTVPRHGMIQFHPSLLPRYRGPSSINWPIIRGDTRTGLTIFRPTDGLDEGPVILTRSVPIEDEDTLGSLYFGKIFPMGVAALVEVAEKVVAGTAPALAQYEPNAGYKGIIREPESNRNGAYHVDITYNLIRGCNPAPGAWTTFEGKKLYLFECTKRIARTFSEVKGKKIGQVVAQNGSSLVIHGQGGFIEVHRVRWDGGKKVAAGDAELPVGSVLGL